MIERKPRGPVGGMASFATVAYWPGGTKQQERRPEDDQCEEEGDNHEAHHASHLDPRDCQNGEREEGLKHVGVRPPERYWSSRFTICECDHSL